VAGDGRAAAEAAVAAAGDGCADLAAAAAATAAAAAAAAAVNGSPALLMLEDGSCFPGIGCGAPGEAFGEICFNTSMVGYLEIISDPSYAGQIITMTYPQIGNYGVSRTDLQRDKLALRGLVLRDICYQPSNFRSEMSLPQFLAKNGVVAISEVDTRRLTRHIRDNGAMRAVISNPGKCRLNHPAPSSDQSAPVPPGQIPPLPQVGAAFARIGLGQIDSESGTEAFIGTSLAFDPGLLLERLRQSPSIVNVNLAQTVSVDAPYQYQPDDAAYDFLLKPAGPKRHHVVAYDCGAKFGILRNLHRAGCEVTVVPWDTPAAEVLALGPDGVFFSNGPGDPEPVRQTALAARELMGKLPLFGICLGHQMMALAAGCQIEKLKFGHRGANHPVMNLRTGRVEITAQNHGFGVVFPSLGQLLPKESGMVAEHPDDLRFWVSQGVAPVLQNPRFGRVQLTHVNLNDGTVEGLAFLDFPAFCVQYHPEASPGPTDAHYLFSAFTRLMDGSADYLDIDIATDRLGEWK
jgi:carbamoyl-phosphate synthase small subunit